MTDTPLPISHWAILTVTGFTLGGSYFFIQGLDTPKQWWLLGLLLAFICITTLVILRKIKRYQQIALSALFLLCTVMMLLSPKHIAMLYVVICLLVIETQYKQIAIFWVSLCVVAVITSELLYSPELKNLQDAIVNGLLTLFLSGFAFLRIEAETGRRHTRQLLNELKDKNRQLANYAAEREYQSRTEERQSLSRELHDTLGHKLTTSIVHLANNFESVTDINIKLKITYDETQIAPNIKQHIFRIVQEALTNISRHADATQVSIKLESKDFITLCVEDNGKRLDNKVGALTPAKSIVSRIAELKGKTSFERSDGRTRLRVEIPSAQIGTINEQ